MGPHRVLAGLSLALAFALAAGAPHAGAQVGPTPPAFPEWGSSRVGALQGATGMSFEAYRFDTPGDVDMESLRLVTIPVAARIGVARGWEIQLSSAWARADLTRDDGSGARMEGATDTEIRLLTRVGGGRLTLTAVGVLPSGTASLTEEQADVAGMIAADVLPFRISTWGTGGGIGLSTALAGQVGAGVGAGLVLSVLRERGFEPFEGAFTYRPGHQTEVRGVLDRTFGTSAKAAVQLGFLHFGADLSDGSNVFQSGSRLQGVGSLAFALGPRSSGIVYLGYQHRREGAYAVDSRVIPLQDLVFAGGGMRIPLGGVVLEPTVDLRNVSGDVVAGGGSTVTLGSAVEVRAGAVTWVPTIRGRLGDVGLRDGRESRFSGVDLGLGVRFGGVAR